MWFCRNEFIAAPKLESVHIDRKRGSRMGKAEDAIKAREGDSTPPVNPYVQKFERILSESIPEALRRLESADWKGGKIYRVRVMNDDGRATEDVAAWKLSTLIYLTSRGKLAIMVTDPLGDLQYDIAEVSLNYLVEHHSNTKTVQFLDRRISALK